METNVAIDAPEKERSWIRTALWVYLGFKVLQAGFKLAWLPAGTETGRFIRSGRN